MNKTKVMISRERQKPLQKAARWPCGVCGRGVGSNSTQCTSCHKWVHKKCSDIKGSMYKMMRSFICRGCSNPVIMVALWNRADHYIFMLWFVLSSSVYGPCNCRVDFPCTPYTWRCNGYVHVSPAHGPCRRPVYTAVYMALTFTRPIHGDNSASR